MNYLVIPEHITRDAIRFIADNVAVEDIFGGYYFPITPFMTFLAHYIYKRADTQIEVSNPFIS